MVDDRKKEREEKEAVVACEHETKPVQAPQECLFKRPPRQADHEASHAGELQQMLVRVGQDRDGFGVGVQRHGRSPFLGGHDVLRAARVS